MMQRFGLFCLVLFSGRKSKTSSIKQRENQESAAGILEADRTGQMWGHDYTEHSGIIKMQDSICHVKYGSKKGVWRCVSTSKCCWHPCLQLLLQLGSFLDFFVRQPCPHTSIRECATSRVSWRGLHVQKHTQYFGSDDRKRRSVTSVTCSSIRRGAELFGFRYPSHLESENVLRWKEPQGISSPATCSKQDPF